MSALTTLTLLALISVSSCRASDCSYVGLLTHLNLTTTNEVLANVRPVKNWTTSTLVQMDMFLYGILQVDGKSQTVTSHIWIQMRWANEFLSWNSSEFCGIDAVTVPRSKLWIPDVQIQEDASDTGSIFNSPIATVFSSGDVLANARQRLTSTCLLNLFLFPFDTQWCNFTFASMNSFASAITLGTVYGSDLLTLLSERSMVTEGEWELDKMEIISCAEKDQSKLIYVVKISRKSLLHVINFIAPLTLFLALDVASFFISEARGEKLSFKVTILLSISVLLLILKDMLPSTENKLPMIATYCVVIFDLVGVSVLETMLVSFLFDLDDAFLLRKTKSPVDGQVDVHLQDDSHKEPPGAEEAPDKSPLPVVRPDDRHLLQLILEEVTAGRQEVKGRDAKKPGRYRRLAEVINSVFFVFYFLTVGVFLTYMYITWVLPMFSN